MYEDFKRYTDEISHEQTCTWLRNSNCYDVYSSVKHGYETAP